MCIPNLNGTIHGQKVVAVPTGDAVPIVREDNTIYKPALTRQLLIAFPCRNVPDVNTRVAFSPVFFHRHETITVQRERDGYDHFVTHECSYVGAGTCFPEADGLVVEPGGDEIAARRGDDTLDSLGVSLDLGTAWTGTYIP